MYHRSDIDRFGFSFTLPYNPRRGPSSFLANCRAAGSAVLWLPICGRVSGNAWCLASRGCRATRHHWSRWRLALILGGGAGNLYDRIVHGHVG